MGKVEAVTDFIFLGSKITVDGDCSHKIKRLLLLGRKTMKNLDSILKRTHITLPTKAHMVHMVKSMFCFGFFFSTHIWMWQLDLKAEHQRTGAFQLWCCRRLLRVPWTARRSNQSILKEINPEYSLEGLMLKLKLQCFGSLISNSLEKMLPDAGKDWRQEEKGTTWGMAEANTAL